MNIHSSQQDAPVFQIIIYVFEQQVIYVSTRIVPQKF